MNQNSSQVIFFLTSYCKKFPNLSTKMPQSRFKLRRLLNCQTTPGPKRTWCKAIFGGPSLWHLNSCKIKFLQRVTLGTGFCNNSQKVLKLTRFMNYTYWLNIDIGLIWHNISRKNLKSNNSRLNLCTINYRTAPFNRL